MNGKVMDREVVLSVGDRIVIEKRRGETLGFEVLAADCRGALNGQGQDVPGAAGRVFLLLKTWSRFVGRLVAWTTAILGCLLVAVVLSAVFTLQASGATEQKHVVEVSPSARPPMARHPLVDV